MYDVYIERATCMYDESYAMYLLYDALLVHTGMCILVVLICTYVR